MIAGRRRKAILERVQGSIRRPTRYVKDVQLNYVLMNCQSLKNKLSSLAENFKINGSAFIVTNETWFKQKDPQLKKYLEDMEDKFSIKALRKDRKTGRSGLAHGGVGVFYDSNKCSLRKFPLNALRGKDVREFELLAVRGNIRGVKREIVIFSFYMPPKFVKKDSELVIETLIDAVSEARAKANSPWIVIAGDWNRYDTSGISKAFPDIKKLTTLVDRSLCFMAQSTNKC